MANRKPSRPSLLPGRRHEPGKTKAKAKPKPDSVELLHGWQQIARFLGQPVSVVERWAKSGMPVARKGRSVIASISDLNQWLERESGEPVHLATADTDLSRELKRGVSYFRH